jgi:hypothetical protein
LTGEDGQPLPTWVFGRDSTTISLRRHPGLSLEVVSSEAHRRVFTFDDIDTLTAFQCNFEAHLVDSGWTLLDFTPERRSGRERRARPRPSTDRRRYPWRP